MVDLMFHKSKRHDRKNLVIKHCIKKCTGTVGFPDCLDRNLMSGDIFLKELSSSASLLTHGKGFFGKILHLNIIFLIKRMIFTYGKYQTVIYDRENAKIRGKNLTFYNSHIQFRTKKLLFNVLGITHIGMNPDFRTEFLKLRNQKRCKAGSDRDCGTKFQGRGLPLV